MVLGASMCLQRTLEESDRYSRSPLEMTVVTDAIEQKAKGESYRHYAHRNGVERDLLLYWVAKYQSGAHWET